MKKREEGWGVIKWAQVFSLEEKIPVINVSAHYNGVNVFMPMNS